MPSTTFKKDRTAGKTLTGKNALSCLCITGDQIGPRAGMGACSKCSCKKYVPETNRQSNSITSHQAFPCASCGHDVKFHANT